MMMYCDTKEKCFVHNLVFLNWIIICYYIQQNKTYQNRVSICDSICASSGHADLIYERDEIKTVIRYEFSVQESDRNSVEDPKSGDADFSQLGRKLIVGRKRKRLLF